ncbi:hypothetical protein [Amycolatopsis orientalis]|nr:hypothetical protein [Amycolatopsis orientalis]
MDRFTDVDRLPDWLDDGDITRAFTDPGNITKAATDVRNEALLGFFKQL